MKAVILAGGKGQRMGEAGRETPKPMMEIGGVPVLEHQVRLLVSYGFTDLTIVTGHLSRQIEQHLKDGLEFGIPISYFVEKNPLGTTGALKEMEADLPEEFLVLYGDVMLDMDLLRMWRFHKLKNSACTLAVHPNNHPFDSDLVVMKRDGTVFDVLSKPHPEGLYYRNLVNAGAYVLSRKMLSFFNPGVAEDFARDVLPKMCAAAPVYAYLTPEYLKDIGTPDRLEEVRRDYVSGQLARMNRRFPRKAVFLDRDGVINPESGLLTTCEQFSLLPGAARGIKKLNDAGFLVIVVTNQPSVAKNFCSIDEVERTHMKMETLLGRHGARLDAVYFCPHHPEAGHPGENAEYKIPCACRKPGTGMIEQACREFNIDMSSSYMVGDSDSDLLCGKKSGLRTFLVRSSRQVREEAEQVFDNLLAAADFIVGEQS
ncbi:MAG TPA: HAD-IIIA family hydrolase [Elusimicrobiales bacterium]|nr:HAD-IIIA family hydrolase [Elusimicrobiales bacterium]